MKNSTAMFLVGALATCGCMPAQLVERPSQLQAALGAGHVTLDGPFGPVVLPRHCLDAPGDAAAGLTASTPLGCASVRAFDNSVARKDDLVAPLPPGASRSRPRAEAAAAYLGGIGGGGRSTPSTGGQTIERQPSSDMAQPATGS